MPSKLLFLPGASGNIAFWEPVAAMLLNPATRVHCGWPGFGPTPSDPNVRGIDDLVSRVVAEINQPTALIAQSMGGVVALRAALQRPQLVTHLILTATSGGIDVAAFGAEDWRDAFFEANPSAPRWFAQPQQDLSPHLQAIEAPTLLLWGDSDPISPASVGEHLQNMLPNAELKIFKGGTHDLANVFANEIAPLIDAHLRVA